MVPPMIPTPAQRPPPVAAPRAPLPPATARGNDPADPDLHLGLRRSAGRARCADAARQRPGRAADAAAPPGAVLSWNDPSGESQTVIRPRGGAPAPGGGGAIPDDDARPLARLRRAGAAAPVAAAGAAAPPPRPQPPVMAPPSPSAHAPAAPPPMRTTAGAPAWQPPPNVGRRLPRGATALMRRTPQCRHRRADRGAARRPRRAQPAARSAGPDAGADAPDRPPGPRGDARHGRSAGGAAALKREIRAEVTMIVTRENNPLKFSPSVEVALGHLLSPPARGFMESDKAMRDAYDDLRAHQFGFLAGMRAALEGILKRFDPATLEGKLTQKSLLSSILPGQRKAQMWEVFTQLYSQISSEASDDFHELSARSSCARTTNTSTSWPGSAMMANAPRGVAGDPDRADGTRRPCRAAAVATTTRTPAATGTRTAICAASSPTAPAVTAAATRPRSWRCSSSSALCRRLRTARPRRSSG